MPYLAGKRILFLSPSFFHYPDEIVKTLEEKGASVISFDERPSNDFITKVALRLGMRFLLQRNIKLYYQNILSGIADKKIDFIFLIVPESIPVSFINELRNRNTNLKVYLYMWDSFRNKSYAKKIHGLSDLTFSFDPKDLSEDVKLEFLPLFYTNEYSFSRKEKYDYDVTFIGTLHSDRYILTKSVEQQLASNGLKVFTFFYSPSRFLFLLQKILNKNFRSIKFCDVSFKSLSRFDVVSKITRSRAVLDVQHPGQTGLTMRTIEVLGAGRKLITTNENIKSYKFFSDNNILVIERNNPIVNLEFLRKDCDESVLEEVAGYSLSNWIDTIFNEVQKNK